MKPNNWIEKGFASLEAHQWFDGIQLLRGALQRAFQLNQPENAELILEKTSDYLLSNQKSNLFCHFVFEILPLFGKKNRDEKWIAIFPIIIDTLRRGKLDECANKLMNKVILSKMFNEDFFLKELTLQIDNNKFSNETIFDFFYILAGLRLIRKEYIECFEILSEWYKVNSSSPRLISYLTLAELNAFEIEGCGNFLKQLKVEFELNRYIEIVKQLFKATELTDYSLFKSIIEDNADLVNSQEDALFKLLCDGILDFLKPKDNKGLMSLFRG
jgi:hypothetical protein